ncbi:hypothetical protein [Natronorubrum halophilum]|uniref:hypothetical protein n=1 Tax=Natronorubrum halophilum TaxID=1702106 RepID=UPI0010C21147|nr:hypothetical protein [Natronorubrum halophilum]
MTMYDRSPSTDYRPIDEFDGGFGWLAHPQEIGMRASHALVGDRDRVWLFDPLEAFGIEDELETFGEVAGVVVCSDYHARDAGTFARRYDVPVFVPPWNDRVPSQLEDVSLEIVDGEIGTSGFSIREASPFPGWSEAIAYRRSDATLYVPDLLGTAPLYLAGDERLALYLLCRLTPPTAAFAGIAPERILVGHGTGVFDDATGSLATAFESSRRGFPRALLTNGGPQLRALADAL